MGTGTTDRRCKSCHKLLLDEKLPFCRRCMLEGRNKAGQVGGVVGGTLMTIYSAIALVNNSDHHSSDDDDEDEEV
jgi:uncharacterized paraquat-inducible protein A